jgi:hypothetical protein
MLLFWVNNLFRVLYKQRKYRYFPMLCFYLSALVVIVSQICFFSWSLYYQCEDELVLFWDGLTVQSLLCCGVWLNLAMVELILVFRAEITRCKITLLYTSHIFFCIFILLVYILLYFSTVNNTFYQFKTVIHSTEYIAG